MSTGRSGPGLCPTRNRLDNIGFLARKPTVDHKNQWVKSDRSCLIGGRIGWSRQWCCWRFLLTAICIFRWIFAEFVQKSLDLSKKKKIITGFLQNSRDLSKKTPNRHRIWAKTIGVRRTWAKPIIFSPDLSLIWAKPTRL